MSNLAIKKNYLEYLSDIKAPNKEEQKETE